MHTPEQRQEIRERFLQVDTANVADVLDEIGLFDQGLASDLLDLGAGRVAGWAYTITGQMIPYDDDGDARKMEACGGVGEGEVTVWSGGATGVCYFGELIALGMMERGSTGAVIDGGVRDVRWLKEHGFPVFGRYRTPVQSIKRWRVTEWQVPVYLPGATTERVVVRPGDFLLGDEDGLIVVPVEHVDDVLKRSEEMTQTEVQIREALRSGTSLSDALEQFGHV
jgi:4-hydroxy-4-methyl-2-oxoglutarate aldolase